MNTRNTKQKYRETKENKNNNLYIYILNTYMKYPTNNDNPNNIDNYYRIINKSEYFIFKGIILRKNKFQKIASNFISYFKFVKLFTDCETVVETPPINSRTREFALIKAYIPPT